MFFFSLVNFVTKYSEELCNKKKNLQRRSESYFLFQKDLLLRIEKMLERMEEKQDTLQYNQLRLEEEVQNLSDSFFDLKRRLKKKPDAPAPSAEPPSPAIQTLVLPSDPSPVPVTQGFLLTGLEQLEQSELTPLPVTPTQATPPKLSSPSAKRRKSPLSTHVKKQLTDLYSPQTLATHMFSKDFKERTRKFKGKEITSHPLTPRRITQIYNSSLHFPGFTPAKFQTLVNEKCRKERIKYDKKKVNELSSS